MAFLCRELDDPTAEPCGRCAPCRGELHVPGGVDPDLERAAVAFLRRCDIPIEPRRQWPGDALYGEHGWRGRIPAQLQSQEGRALCMWGDAGWGKLVRRGKQVDLHFDDALVQAAASLVGGRWRPQPAPAWVTCVPSLRLPHLVPDFARGLAAALGVPFRPCV